jgi:hypothetical protein
MVEEDPVSCAPRCLFTTPHHPSHQDIAVISANAQHPPSHHVNGLAICKQFAIWKALESGAYFQDHPVNQPIRWRSQYHVQINVPYLVPRAHMGSSFILLSIRPRAVCLNHMRNSFRISVYPIGYTVKVLDVRNTSSQSGREPVPWDRVHIVYGACKVHSIPSGTVPRPSAN